MERRSDERIETNIQLTCRVPARPRPAVMHDLSHLGCRLEFREADVELGGTVVLEPPAVRAFAGQVVWTRQRQVGVQFERPLSNAASVALGLDEPEPEPVHEPEPESAANLSGLLRHWMRRLTGRFA
ncbi:MAG TPA: PilZ domain-containing protein [Croceibacterium sp.]|nr:PilZ domain-containing protein [Croceibacterium sp.]